MAAKPKTTPKTSGDKFTWKPGDIEITKPASGTDSKAKTKPKSVRVKK